MQTSCYYPHSACEQKQNFLSEQLSYITDFSIGIIIAVVVHETTVSLTVELITVLCNSFQPTYTKQQFLNGNY